MAQHVVAPHDPPFPGPFLDLDDMPENTLHDQAIALLVQILSWWAQRLDLDALVSARGGRGRDVQRRLAGWANRPPLGEVAAALRLDLRPLADALDHCWPRGAGRERQGSGEGRGERARGGSRGPPVVQGGVR